MLAIRLHRYAPLADAAGIQAGSWQYEAQSYESPEEPSTALCIHLSQADSRYAAHVLVWSRPGAS